MSSQILIMSDVHLCPKGWHGLTTAERMEKMVADLNAAYEKDPYDAIFFLGDYSLDHWVYETGGTYLHEKVSYTQKLAESYLPRLSCGTHYLIPGNHEQYGHLKWQQITGCQRQFAVQHGGYLVLMLDNFGADLDPETDSDGTYTPADVAFIRQQLEACPDMPVLLCAHFFDMRRETEAFCELVRTEKRIVCLFCGHDHVNRVEAHPALGGKLIIHDGHFSYPGFHNPARCPWGWLKVMLYEEGVTCTYVHPESRMDDTLIHAGEGPMIQIALDAGCPLPRKR